MKLPFTLQVSERDLDSKQKQISLNTFTYFSSVGITGRGLRGVDPLVHVFNPPILSSMFTFGAADPLVLLA